MKGIPDGSIDMILCDLPYGTTACKWDAVIPFNKYVQIGEKVIYEQEYVFDKMKSGVSYKEALEDFLSISKDGLWDNYKRIIKDRGAIVLFGSEPFSSYLRVSNIKMFKYDWIWDKHIPRNFVNAKIMPMNKHENISVFSVGKTNYYPIMVERDKPVTVKNYAKKGRDSTYKINTEGQTLKSYTYTHRNPDTIIHGLWEANAGKVHPTQKPVALLEYLIKTYTQEGETVLDNCMGSGSTGVACINTKRNFIGIEKDDKYFEIAKKRIEEAIHGLSQN
jgi:site-specific DNA-methyltransferase (adenine-specific)